MPDRSTTERPPSPLASGSLTQLLAMVSRAVTARVENILKPDGLSLDHWLVMEAIAKQRGLTMADLATKTLITGPTLTRVVDRLVGNAIAYREVDTEDRRKVRVYLSPRGRLMYRRLAEKVREVEEALLRQADHPAVVVHLLTRWAEPPED